MTALAQRAIGWRHGVVADAGPVPATLADPPIANWGATSAPLAGGSSAGAAAFAGDDDLARTAAVAEAVERYAASVCAAGTAYRLADNQPVAGFDDVLSLRAPGATSSGLAADPSPLRALLRAAQELIERDALMTTWLHGVAARRVDLPDALLEPVLRLAGTATAFNLTPAYSPHPVAAVAGCIPRRGRPRLSMGLACRSRWDDALAKAWLEWAQGVVFAGMRADEIGPLSPKDVTDFDRHAVYYTVNPEQWDGLPLFGGPRTDRPPDAEVVGAPTDELHALAHCGVELLYRDLTTVDAAHIGLRVVRVVAPDLTPIHADHNHPALNARSHDLHWRYPWATPTATSFPNPMPHPLG
jgi:ribosomal protein S12 methylthiotransferase accessory factor